MELLRGVMQIQCGLRSSKVRSIIPSALPILTFFLWSSSAFAQTLALTFDDGLNPATESNARLWNEQILASLKDLEITSMVFPSLSRIGDEKGLALISLWAEAGHSVGNHTSKHRNLSSDQLTLEDFIVDVKEADFVLRHFPTWIPMLRFPFLKEGNTIEKREGIRSWMRSNGYRPAPVSIDASDWYYNQIFTALSKTGKDEKGAKVKQVYKEHLIDRAVYYDGLARRVLGRSPSHVLLLHISELNASSLRDIVTAFQLQGWSFVSPRSAFDDPLYASQPDTLPAGESIVWSIAKERNIQNLRYPAEDSIYEEPSSMSWAFCHSC